MQTKTFVRSEACKWRLAYHMRVLMCFAPVIFSLASAHSVAAASTFTDANWISMGVSTAQMTKLTRQ